MISMNSGVLDLNTLRKVISAPFAFVALPCAVCPSVAMLGVAITETGPASHKNTHAPNKREQLRNLIDGLRCVVAPSVLLPTSPQSWPRPWPRISAVGNSPWTSCYLRAAHNAGAAVLSACGKAPRPEHPRRRTAQAFLPSARAPVPSPAFAVYRRSHIPPPTLSLPAASNYAPPRHVAPRP